MKNRTRLAAGIGGAITGAGLLAIQFVGGWEGLRLAAYQDVVGVWTACYGETKGIRPGMKFTREQCDAMFIGSLTSHEQGMRRCLKAPDAIPERTYVSFVSFTYNVGVGAFCGSTLRRKADAGDLAGACRELPKWNKAGGRVVKGLVNRRAAELKLCLAGLADKAPLPAPAPLEPARPDPAPKPAPLPPVAAEPAPAPAAAPEATGWGHLVGLAIGAALAIGVVVFVARRRKGK